MAGFCDDEFGCYGSMVIDAFPLNCPGWDLTGYQATWAEFAIRTDTVILPTTSGQRSYPGRVDQSEYEMTLYVNGEANSIGEPYANPWQGLYNNIQQLWNNAFAPVGTGRGTRDAVLTLPWGGTISAAVKFEPLAQVNEIEDPRFAVYRTTMSVPAGRFLP